MEKIRIRTAGTLQLDAWRNDTIQFIVLEDLLKAMKIEYIEGLIDNIKQDLHWYASIKQLNIPNVGTRDAIQITHALGLIYWLPDTIVELILKREVYSILALHLEFHLELFNWKYDMLENYAEKMDMAYYEMEKANNIIIKNQVLIIDVLSSNLKKYIHNY